MSIQPELTPASSDSSDSLVTPVPAPFSFVDRPDQLPQLLAALETAAEVALDTEADSMHHYREKLCLVQISAGGEHWVIDPLSSGLDLTALVRLLETHSLLLHGADYDLRMLGRTYGFRPAKIFDTMLAAQLLGLPEIGLAAMVQRVEGIALSKHGQRADWSLRPLPPGLLTYAVDDTRFLAGVADSLRRELQAKGRLEWLEESCERLLDATADVDSVPLERDSEDAWRIKGCKKIAGRPGALLRELWRWREAIARRTDRPPFRVAPNELLLSWVKWITENPDAMPEDMPERPVWLRGQKLEGFEAAVLHALAMPKNEWPKPPEKAPQGYRMTQEEEEQLKKILKARDKVAESLAIQPGVLGPREALKNLLRAKIKTEEELRERTGLMAWQARNLAPELLPLLE